MNTTMAEQVEMAVPKWSTDIVISIFISTILVLATLIALVNLALRAEFIASCIWLAIMAWGLWSVRKTVVVDVLGVLGKHFVQAAPHDDGSVEIRLGFRLVGHTFITFKVPLEKIESVEWQPGQAPNFWHVFVWFDHDDPEKSERKAGLRKPDQDVYCVGPSSRRRRTEAIGLAFVDFLRQAGATLVRADQDCKYIRA